MTAIAILNREAIIEQVAQGKRLSDIAPALGISPQAVSKVLKSDPEYRSAIEVGFHLRLDEAEREIEAACESVDVARARARFQSVAWRAEREFPETWAQKSELRVEHVGDLGERLRRAQERLVGSGSGVVSEQQALPADVIHKPSD